MFCLQLGSSEESKQATLHSCLAVLVRVEIAYLFLAKLLEHCTYEETLECQEFRIRSAKHDILLGLDMQT